MLELASFLPVVDPRRARYQAEALRSTEPRPALSRANRRQRRPSGSCRLPLAQQGRCR
jgi:hypothetical protein